MNTLSSVPTSGVPAWLGAIGVFLFATIWFVLPLLPAINEFQRRTDDTPLRIVREYDGNVRFFAHGFMSFLDKQWKDARATVRDTRTDREGTFPDGSHFLITPGTGTLALSPREKSKRTVDRVIACGGRMNLPDSLYFAREILAMRILIGGDGNVYRAICGEEGISLGRDSVVLRWLHANGAVETGRDTHLYGRASSEERIHLADGNFFQRLHAPVLEFGGAGNAPVAMGGDISSAFDNSTLKRIEKLPGEYDKISGRHLAADDLKIDDRSLYQGDVVTLRSLRLGDGSRIEGSLKSRREMHIERGCNINGSLVSEGDMFIAADCRIKGPIISEGRVVIAPGVQIGSLNAPTTISAPIIEIAPGSTAYGTVWARDEGFVRAQSSNSSAA